MEKELQIQINLSAPNLVNICVDHNDHGRLSGRLYHCYREEALPFTDLMELLRILENFFDEISFPQASTKTRSFLEKEQVLYQGKRTDKVTDQEEIIKYSGELGTFVTRVMFRQSSTWQGEMTWMETGQKYCFSNALNFIKLMDWALCGEGKPLAGDETE